MKKEKEKKDIKEKTEDKKSSLLEERSEAGIGKKEKEEKDRQENRKGKKKA